MKIFKNTKIMVSLLVLLLSLMGLQTVFAVDAPQMPSVESPTSSGSNAQDVFQSKFGNVQDQVKLDTQSGIPDDKVFNDALQNTQQKGNDLLGNQQNKQLDTSKNWNFNSLKGQFALPDNSGALANASKPSGWGAAFSANSTPQGDWLGGIKKPDGYGEGLSGLAGDIVQFGKALAHPGQQEMYDPVTGKKGWYDIDEYKPRAIKSGNGDNKLYAVKMNVFDKAQSRTVRDFSRNGVLSCHTQRPINTITSAKWNPKTGKIDYTYKKVNDSYSAYDPMTHSYRVGSDGKTIGWTNKAPGLGWQEDPKTGHVIDQTTYKFDRNTMTREPNALMRALLPVH